MGIIDCSNPEISEEIGNQVEYTLSNGEELYNFLFANPSVLGSVANLISMHWNTSGVLEWTLKQQLESDLNEIIGDKWREDHE